MADTLTTVKGFLRLARIHSVIATALAPVLGAYGAFANENIPSNLNLWYILIDLFFVGVAVHIFGEILNDYADYNLDKTNPELSQKPLVSGAISKKTALISMAISLTLIFIIAIPVITLLSLFVLVLGIILVILYDLFSKRFVNSAFLLAGWAFCMGVFGGICTGNYRALTEIAPLVWIISLLGGFQLWMNTAVLGHLKDVQNDGRAGILTFPIYMGVKIIGKIIGTGKNPQLSIPMHFRTLVIVLQVFNIGIAFIPLIFWNAFYIENNYFIQEVFVILILLSVIIMASLIWILWYTVFNRKKLMRFMAVREVSAYFLVIGLLLPITGILIATLFVFMPLVWFIAVNYIFTGNPFEPRSEAYGDFSKITIQYHCIIVLFSN